MEYEQHYEYLKKWLLDYVDRVMPEEEGIIQEGMLLKMDHTFRVVERIKEICTRIGAPKRHVQIAEMTALLHDVGRFVQLAEQGSFVDATLDHGEAGADTIEAAGLLDNLDEEDRAAIVTAVRYHNDYAIPALLTHHELLFIRLLRDADKIDILYGESRLYRKEDIAAKLDGGLNRTTGISSKVVEAVEVGIQIPTELVKNINDLRVARISWIFDLNFPATLKMAQNYGFFTELANELPNTATVKRVLNAVNQYATAKFGRTVFTI